MRRGGGDHVLDAIGRRACRMAGEAPMRAAMRPVTASADNALDNAIDSGMVWGDGQTRAADGD